jgi:vesicle-fusing ATPase
MVENKLLGPDVSLEKLAKITKNYTGAELEAVVKSATTHAFARSTNMMEFGKQASVNDDCKVEHNDFLQAIEEVKPQFGVDTDKFESLLRNKIIDFGPGFKKTQDLLNNMINQIKFGKSSQLVSVLIEGETGTGKSAVAAWAALQSEFSYVKLISAENFVGYHETGKVEAIVSIFNDAYRSTQSLIVLDDIERIMEFVNIGPRFSNVILQALMVLIKKVPPKIANRLLIIGTTSQKNILKELELYQTFNSTVSLKPLARDEVLAILKHYKGDNREKEQIADSMQFMTIKTLLLLIDMAMQGEDILTYDRFMQCYDESGKDEF